MASEDANDRAWDDLARAESLDVVAESEYQHGVDNEESSIAVQSSALENLGHISALTPQTA